MLRVTVEMVPFGEESIKRQLAVVTISNISPYKRGSEGPELCEYAVEYLIPDKKQSGRVTVKEFDRAWGMTALVESAFHLIREREDGLVPQPSCAGGTR